MGVPDLHGLASRLDGLRALVDEREERSRERHAALKESIAQALAAADKATDKAEAAISRRLEAGNEIKAAMEDQAKRLATRVEVASVREAMDLRFESITRQLADLQKISNQRTGQAAGAGQSWHVLGLAITAAVGIVAIVAFIRTL